MKKQTEELSTYTPPARMTHWMPADLDAQPVAALLGIPPLVRPVYVPKGGDMTPEEFAAFEERMARLLIESASWPLPEGVRLLAEPTDEEIEEVGL